MPKKYKPVLRAIKLKYTPESVEAALSSITEGMSIQQAAKTYNIPYTTLNRHLGKAREIEQPPIDTTIPPHEELAIAHSIVDLADLGYTLDIDKVCEIVQTYIKRSRLLVPKFTDNLPDREWIMGFLQRHKEVISKGICQSILRKQARLSDEEINNLYTNFYKSKEEKNESENIMSPIQTDSDTSNCERDNLLSECGSGNEGSSGSDSEEKMEDLKS